MRRFALHGLSVTLAAGALAATQVLAQAPQAPDSQAPKGGEALRVCADPNSLPQSNDRGEGYENKKIGRASCRERV